MAKFLTRITDGIRKHPFLTINIILAFWYTVFMAVLITVLCTLHVVPELKTTTGTVAWFKDHERTDPDALDYILNVTDSSYLNIKLTDGESYKADGISYENIDRGLFTVLAVGGEIKLTYEDQGFGGGVDRIYGIEYEGKEYLAVDAALSDLKSERKITVIVCPVILGVRTTLVIAWGIFNYFKFRKKKENSELGTLY